MPTYEYECKDCKEKFDISQSMSAEPLKVCPKCKGHLKRLIGKGSGIIFKGSGFYATDYKKAGSKNLSPCASSDKGESCKNCPAAKTKNG